MNVEITQMGNRESAAITQVLKHSWTFLNSLRCSWISVTETDRHHLREITENKTSCCTHRAVSSPDQSSAFTPCSLGTRAHHAPIRDLLMLPARPSPVKADPSRAPPVPGDTSRRRIHESLPGAGAALAAARGYARWNTCRKVEGKKKKKERK